MLRLGLFLIGAGIILLISTGCAVLNPGPSLVERDYGNSYNLAKHNQILNPDAAKNLEPVTGFDGNAAQKTMEKYRKDFERPTPPPTYVLGLSSTGK
jgi:hypothetical protein